MKKSNRILLAALTLGGALFAQSCEELTDPKDIIPEPVFPETEVKKEIVEGQEVTEFNIQPNQAWKVEVLGEGAGTIFWIDDEGIKETSISGKEAEDVKFTVTFDQKREFDVNRICEVKLTMGAKSKVIGTLTRSALTRTLTFKTAKVDMEKGEFLKDYEKAAQADLVSFKGSTAYERPVQIYANYAWSLVLPDFCAAYVDGKLVEGAVKGESNKVVELLLKAKLTKEVVGGAAGNLKVVDNSNADKLSEVKVVLPDISGRIELEAAQNTEFNEKGELKLAMGFQAQPAIAYILSTEDVVFKALPFEGEWYGKKFADWVTFESGWDKAGAALQHYDLSMSVSAFEEAGERYADILVLPKSMDSANIDDFLTSDGSALAKKYEPYLLNRLTQIGLAKPFLTSEMSAEELESCGASLVQDDQDWPVQAYGAKQGFKVAYTSEWAGEDVTFKIDAPVDHYEVVAFSEDPMRPEFNVEDLDNFWLTFSSFGPDGKSAKIYMDPKAIGDLMPEAVLLLYTAGATEPVAAVHCNYAAELPDVPGSELISISTGNGTIKKLGEEDEWFWNLSNEFSTQEVYEVTTSDFVLSMKLAKEYWNILLLQAKAPYEDLADNSFSVESMGDVYVYVGEQVTSRAECVIVFKDELGLNMAAVHYIYDPEAAAPAGAPFEFAYPTLVQNAELTPYTGDMSIFMGDFGQVDPSIVMQLTYTGPEQQAILNVPGLPLGEGPYTESPWLSYELQGENQIMINMANSPLNEVGYYVWTNDMGMLKAILVCTRTAIGWE